MSHTKQESYRTLQSESLTVRLLQALSVHPTSIHELADAPADQVAATIACALQTPGVASIAGWVVETLRRQRDAGWPGQPPGNSTSRLPPPVAVGGDATDLFRLGSDVADLDQPGDTQPTAPDDSPSLAPEQLSPAFRAALSQRCSRAYRPIIQTVEVRLLGNQTVVFCRTVSDRLRLLTALSGAMRWVIADLGLPDDLVITDGNPLKGEL